MLCRALKQALGACHSPAADARASQRYLGNTLSLRRSFSILGSGKEQENEAQKYLIEQVGVRIEVADEIIKVLNQTGSSATSSGLEQLGETWLQQLVKSIELDLTDKEKKKASRQEKITLLIDNPRVSKHTRKLEIYANETLFNTTCTPIIDDLEFACGGNAACSTCHVVVDPDFFTLLSPPQEDELDMLDLAWEPRPTSRLACQMVLNKHCDGMTVTIPQETNNLF